MASAKRRQLAVIRQDIERVVRDHRRQRHRPVQIDLGLYIAGRRIDIVEVAMGRHPPQPPARQHRAGPAAPLVVILLLFLASPLAYPSALASDAGATAAIRLVLPRSLTTPPIDHNSSRV